jgi:hypothetical protein
MTKQVQKDATYFVRRCEPNFQQIHPNIFPNAENSGIEKLIFIKYFDVEQQSLRYSGSIIANRGTSV